LEIAVTDFETKKRGNGFYQFVAKRQERMGQRRRGHPSYRYNYIVKRVKRRRFGIMKSEGIVVPGDAVNSHTGV
jgi:hypothetical protein